MSVLRYKSWILVPDSVRVGGKPIDQSDSSAAGYIPPQAEETFSHKQHTERKTVYEGQLHKCPNCGELLDAFRSHCSSCGYEIRDAVLQAPSESWRKSLNELKLSVWHR